MGLLSYDVYWQCVGVSYKLYHFICCNIPRNSMTSLK